MFDFNVLKKYNDFKRAYIIIYIFIIIRARLRKIIYKLTQFNGRNLGVKKKKKKLVRY